MTSDYKAHMNLTRRVDSQPVPLRQTLADLLAQIADSDRWQQRLVNNWLDGYLASERAHADDYDRGFDDGVMALKRAQHDAHGLVELDARRWELRGEKRSRETFARPHPDDFIPGGAAA